MKKVLLVTETLQAPYDEGIKKTVFNLYKDLKNNYVLKVIARYSFDAEDIITVDTNALFFSTNVKRKIKEFRPEVVIYFPFASATFASYLRFKVLSYYAKGAKSIFISLQPKLLKDWQVQIVKLIKPKFALTPSPQLKAFWDKINVHNKLFPLLTDLDIFRPLRKESIKVALREKYNLPVDTFIISHMGHLNEGRNLKSLIPLQRAGYQMVIVGSSSTPKDSLGSPSLKQELVAENIVVLDRYIERIEDIYQLSDAYIFPVVSRTGSIGMPLSIMEARACGIPVVTTDFGSLKHFLGDDFGNIYYAAPHEFLKVVGALEQENKLTRSETKIHEVNYHYLKIIREIIEQ